MLGRKVPAWEGPARLAGDRASRCRQAFPESRGQGTELEQVCRGGQRERGIQWGRKDLCEDHFSDSWAPGASKGLCVPNAPERTVLLTQCLWATSCTHILSLEHFSHMVAETHVNNIQGMMRKQRPRGATRL